MVALWEFRNRPSLGVPARSSFLKAAPVAVDSGIFSFSSNVDAQISDLVADVNLQDWRRLRQTFERMAAGANENGRPRPQVHRPILYFRVVHGDWRALESRSGGSRCALGK